MLRITKDGRLLGLDLGDWRLLFVGFALTELSVFFL
jgi:hypothetical protein